MTDRSIGALRRRLTIEAPSRGTDDGASASTVWSAIGGAWAAILPRSAHEIVSADALAARITHDIEMRWRDDITAAMRLRDGATIYAVHAVRDADGRRRRLLCLCEELAP